MEHGPLPPLPHLGPSQMHLRATPQASSKRRERQRQEEMQEQLRMQPEQHAAQVGAC